MKRISGIIILITIFAFAFSGSVYSASPTFGVKGLLGMSQLTGDIDGTKSKIGFGGGVLARIPMGQGQFMLQPEAQIVLKGAEEDVPDNAEKLKLTYIEIPVLIKYVPAMEGSVQPSFFVGPALGILMSAKIADFDIKDQTKSTDIGIVFGAGVDFAAGSSSKVSVDARYTLGVTNISDDPDDPSDFSIKNAMASVNVAFLFGGGNGDGM